MSKFNNNKTNNTNNGGYTNKRFKKSKEEYEKEKAEQIASQTISLDIINDTAEFLEDFLVNGNYYKITMRQILTHINEECGYTVDKTKIISQFNYILMDLANARKNPHISGDRLNIRVMYIEERLKTSFKSELHDTIRKIIENHPTLFKWDGEATGEDYVALPEGK